MDAHRPAQIAEEISHHAADFLSRESNRKSLITVTRTDLTPDLKNATIYFTVLPQSEEEHALAFARRLLNDFRIYLRRHTRFGAVPHLEFEIDVGEKNRQRIDDLTKK